MTGLWLMRAEGGAWYAWGHLRRGTRPLWALANGVEIATQWSPRWLWRLAGARVDPTAPGGQMLWPRGDLGHIRPAMRKHYRRRKAREAAQWMDGVA